MDDEHDAYRTLQVLPDAHETVIRAAFRALAAIYHPDRDGSASATRRMAALNVAFDQVRTPDRRAVYDRLRRASQRAGETPIVVPPQPTARQRQGASGSGARPGADTLDFGRYDGWTIKQLSRHDPDYLKWLSRHSSGIRYRRQIEEAMRAAEPPSPVPSDKKRRR